MEVTCRTSELDAAGRVVDFGVIKALVGTMIDEKMDHAFVVNPLDTSMRKWLEDNDQKHFVMPDELAEPSSENFAHLIFNWAATLLNTTGLKVVRVRFIETPNCWADYTPPRATVEQLSPPVWDADEA